MHLLDSVMIAIGYAILNGLEPVGVSCILPIHLDLDLSTLVEEHPCLIGYSRRAFGRTLAGPRSEGGIPYRSDGLVRGYFSTLESGSGQFSWGKSRYTWQSVGTPNNR